MDLNDVPFRVVCCSEHQTATFTEATGKQVNVQKNGDKFSVLILSAGKIELVENSINADRAQEIIKDLCTVPL